MTPTLAPIDLTTGRILSDEVYDRIGAAIVDGVYAPGERLRDIDLAAQLGVSRTPVREALQRLERFGLVEIAVGRYTRVSVTSDRLREETGEFTAYFMGNALRMALRRCDDATLAEMLSASEAVLDAAMRQDSLALFERSYVFFESVTRATGNTVFIGVIREASLAIRRNLHGWKPFVGCALARADGYTRLRDCIATRDGDGAEEALRWLHGVE